MRKGYIQVYTGNGKGKTTAALGLALRSAGAGHRVFIAQFIKKRQCSEHKALDRFKDLITVEQYGTGFLKGGRSTKSEVDAAQKGFEEVKDIISSKTYDMVILDEINVAVHHKLLNVEDIVDLLNSRPPNIEIVLTGRYADKKIIQKADIVTDMKAIKHYREKGVKARLGIEK